MSKKHFIALANGIKLHNKLARVNGWTSFTPEQIETIADFCQAQNPNFKRERFISYIAGQCGPNGGAR